MTDLINNTPELTILGEGLGNQILNNDYSESITLSTTKGYLFCKIDDIVCLAAEKRHTIIYLNDGTYYQLSYQGINSLAKYFGAEKGFIRIHRSFIINASYRKFYNKTKERIQLSIPIEGKKWLPVGIKYIEEFERKCEKEHRAFMDISTNKIPRKYLLNYVAYMVTALFNLIPGLGFLPKKPLKIDPK